MIPSSPGSTFKPFVLLAAPPVAPLVCPGTLRIAGRRLDCSHPRLAEPMDAPLALAYSCNHYFAALARRAGRLDLTRFGLNLAPPAGEDQLALAGLGESGVRITALELAQAYRRLIGHDQVLAGLAGAVEYGSAQLAAVEGLEIAGKTGTSANASRTSTHAWFAGWAPAAKPEIVVVVFVQQGRGGATAAPIAREIFAAWKAGAR